MQQLNLNKLLALDICPALSSLAIVATEEYLPLAKYLEDFVIEQIVDSNKYVFQADRYFSFSAVKDIFSSGSLFVETNVVVIYFKTKPNVEQAKQIVELMSLVDESNRLIIICDKLDKKDLASPWFNSLQYALICSGDKTEVSGWICHMLAANNLIIADDAMALLLNYNQGNYSALLQDVVKLTFIYPPQHCINYAEALEQFTDNAQYNVFALSNAYLSGDLSLAIKIFENVCIDSESMILMVWLISEDLRKLIQIKNQQKKGQSLHSAVTSLRVWGSAIQALQTASSRLSYSVLMRCFAEIAEVDCVIKGLSKNDAHFMLKKLLVNLCLGK